MSGALNDQVLVRMPADLHAALKARAAADERSMAATARLAIRLFLHRSPAAIPPAAGEGVELHAAVPSSGPVGVASVQAAAPTGPLPGGEAS